MKKKLIIILLLCFIVNSMWSKVRKSNFIEDDFIRIKVNYSYKNFDYLGKKREETINCKLYCEVENISNDTLYISYPLYKKDNYTMNISSLNISLRDNIYDYSRPIIMESLYKFEPGEIKQFHILCKSELQNLRQSYLLGFDYFINYKKILTDYSSENTYECLNYYFEEESTFWEFIGKADKFCYKVLYTTIDFNQKYWIGE